MRKNIRKMYTYVAKNLITVAIYKCITTLISEMVLSTGKTHRCNCL